MAILCSHPHITIQGCPIKKPLNRVFMLHKSQLPTKKPPTLLIRSSRDDKVFEDRSLGIVCYKDDSGEIICEGYDEGPRFHQQAPRKDYHRRELQIIDSFQQSWFQFVEANGIYQAEKGVAMLEDFDGMVSKNNVN